MTGRNEEFETMFGETLRARREERHAAEPNPFAKEFGARMEPNPFEAAFAAELEARAQAARSQQAPAPKRRRKNPDAPSRREQKKPNIRWLPIITDDRHMDNKFNRQGEVFNGVASAAGRPMADGRAPGSQTSGQPAAMPRAAAPRPPAHGGGMAR
jgi:hypothetical protein